MYRLRIISLHTLQRTGLLGKSAAMHTQCVECGECLEKCPQQIPIPEILARVVAAMEDEGLSQRLTMAREIMMK